MGEMSVLNEYQALQQLLASLEGDALKADTKKAAGSRLRKGLQEVKTKAQALRKTSLEVFKKEAAEAPKA